VILLAYIGMMRVLNACKAPDPGPARKKATKIQVSSMIETDCCR
jgi:hypothetical protein